MAHFVVCKVKQQETLTVPSENNSLGVSVLERGGGGRSERERDRERDSRFSSATLLFFPMRPVGGAVAP